MIKEKTNGKKLLKPPILPIQAEKLGKCKKKLGTDAILASRQKSKTANDIASQLLRENMSVQQRWIFVEKREHWPTKLYHEISLIPFNLYMSDLPPTAAKVFQYADDIAVTYQAKTFDECENNLEAEIEVLNQFFHRWCLQPNPGKT
jgi:hypothetical protein